MTNPSVPPSVPTGDSPARRGARWVAIALIGALGGFAAGMVSGGSQPAGDAGSPTAVLTEDPSTEDPASEDPASEDPAIENSATDDEAGDPAVEDAPVGTAQDPGAAATSTMFAAEVARTVGPAVVRVDARAPGGAGAGSAVVYDTDGLLVTNEHVIADAAEVSVTLPDGSEHPAEVVGSHPPADLALLRISDNSLPTPRWAASDHDLVVGEPVVAIGSPFGLDGSVSLGIVSALGRTVPVDAAQPLVDMVQTDAAINPGNSGGALVDASGQVVGINTAIVSTSGSSAGVGFAVPVATVRSVVEQLLEDGEVRQASLAIAGRTATAEVVDDYGLDADRGVLIVGVQPDGPADLAGLRPGDLVTAIDDTPVTTLGELVATIRLHRPGDHVTLERWRDGEQHVIEVTLGNAALAARPG